MEHSFDVNIAKKYGINVAILLKNLYFWISKNRANGKHSHDAYYWAYNSKKAFAELFPYMTERQIDYALNKMVKSRLIIKGNYNKNAYDRTCWYAITEYGYSILENRKPEKDEPAEQKEPENTASQNCDEGSKTAKRSILQNCEMDLTKLLNRSHTIVRPIPDNKPDNKPDSKKERVKEKSAGEEKKSGSKKKKEQPSRFVPPTLDEVTEYCVAGGKSINPEQFVSYYTSNGWKVGKSPMKNWKAAVRTWELRNRGMEWNRHIARFGSVRAVNQSYERASNYDLDAYEACSIFDNGDLTAKDLERFLKKPAEPLINELISG